MICDICSEVINNERYCQISGGKFEHIRNCKRDIEDIQREMKLLEIFQERINKLKLGKFKFYDIILLCNYYWLS